MALRTGNASTRPRSLAAVAVLGAAFVVACSGSASSNADSTGHAAPRRAAVTTAAVTTGAATATAPTAPAVTSASSPATTTTSAPVAGQTTGGALTSSGGPDVGSKAPGLPLAGKVVGIDPGHNGRNWTDPNFLNHLIWNGRAEEGCDTTGAETDGGYTEPRFNFNVATYLAADLRAEGAKVVLTRTTNTGIGPCVNTRAAIINRAHANVAIDIHADGGPPGGRGFAILEPVADGPNDRVIGASKAFGRDLLARYRAVTGMPVSTYDGVGGINYRSDLAGLNLTTVPKVLIECGNMRNGTDAALLVRASFQKAAAKAFAQAITEYLTKGG